MTSFIKSIIFLRVEEILATNIRNIRKNIYDMVLKKTIINKLGYHCLSAALTLLILLM